MSSALNTSHYSVLPAPFNIFLVNGVEGKKFFTDSITIASLHHADEWSDEPCPVSKYVLAHCVDDMRALFSVDLARYERENERARFRRRFMRRFPASSS